MGKRYTIYDIARISGFSPKTVARVINGEDNVASSTREKIRKVIADIDYEPNAFAKNLKSKKDRIVLASISSPENAPLEWIQMMIERISLLCQQRGITLFVEYCYDPGESIANSILSKNISYIDGVIIFYERKADPRIRLLKDKGIPFVVFERAYDDTVDYVGNANYRILYNVFSTLCSKGLKSTVLFLRKPTLVNIDRVNGVLDAFSDSGLDKSNAEAVYGIAGADEAYEYTSAHLEEIAKKDLIFISGDVRSLGVYRALSEHGIKIGEDISIIGFDDIPASQYLLPSLSTIRPNYPRLAEILIETLFPSSNTVVEKLIMPIFIPRDSLCPAFR